MAAAKKLTAAILARRASKGSRGKRTRPGPRQYTVADLERARNRVAAAERRIDNDHTSNPNRGRAGLERAQLELHMIESQLRLPGEGSLFGCTRSRAKTMLAPITPAIAHSRGELNLARRSDDALSRVQRCVAPHL
jgi:hypothetical protein